MKKSSALSVTAHSDREIVMVREFHASRRLVFEAMTQPDLMKRWLGVFGGWELAICEVDLKVGGHYRWVWKQAGAGSEMGVSGTYREIVPFERIVCTEVFDDAWYPGEAVLTSTFVEHDGKTTFTSVILYSSQAARDGVLKSPMEGGVGASYDNLAELLEKA